jgi:hypothetical protein
MLDEGYLPSLWRVQGTVLRLLVLVVLGSLSFQHLLLAKPSVHRRLANTRRKRRPHVCYPVRALF